MSAHRWQTTLAFVLGIAATISTSVPAHATARSIQIDMNHTWSETSPPPASFPFAGNGSFAVGLTAPGDEDPSISTLYANNTIDVVDWCDDTNDCIPTEGDVPAQLYVSPSALGAGDVEINLYYICSDSFSFSVDGVTPAIPASCSSSAPVNETYIYAANGSLLENYVPEPGTGALFAAALGLLCAGRRRWQRART